MKAKRNAHASYNDGVLGSIVGKKDRAHPMPL